MGETHRCGEASEWLLSTHIILTDFRFHFPQRFTLFGMFSAYQSKQIPLEMSSEVIPMSRIDVDFRFQNRAVCGANPARDDYGVEMEWFLPSKENKVLSRRDRQPVPYRRLRAIIVFLYPSFSVLLRKSLGSGWHPGLSGDDRGEYQDIWSRRRGFPLVMITCSVCHSGDDITELNKTIFYVSYFLCGKGVCYHNVGREGW